MLKLTNSKKLYCNDCECRYSEEYVNHPSCPSCGGTNVVYHVSQHWSHDDINLSYKAIQPLPIVKEKKAIRKSIADTMYQEEGGVCVNLSGLVLDGLDLSMFNFVDADILYCSVSGTKFNKTVLSSNTKGTDLKNAIII